VQTSEHPKVVVVTGGSSGFGRACVDRLAVRGHRVYGTSRRVEFPSPEDSPTSPLIIPMDVREPASIEAAVAFILQREGRLDVLVNNAGIALAGAVEETSIDEARGQFDTNFFGVHCVCRSVLPIMRKQGSGLIVNIGSLGGRISIPFQGFYCASKHALAALTDSLRMEVKPFGIQVTLFEPGDFRTGLTTNRLFAHGSRDASAYADRQNAAIAVMEKDEQGGPDPRQLALLLEQVMAKQRVRPRYLVGMLPQKLAVLAQSALPASVFERLIMSYYRI
jgi:NAD(P)-dependent dehydrogenase (short-subunit alcohol dehydrogenase family)